MSTVQATAQTVVDTAPAVRWLEGMGCEIISIKTGMTSEPTVPVIECRGGQIEDPDNWLLKFDKQAEGGRIYFRREAHGCVIEREFEEPQVEDCGLVESLFTGDKA